MPSIARQSETAGSASAREHAALRRVLAIDYGRKRFGLALSDDLGLTAQPFETIDRVNRREDIRRLRKICRQHSVARIVVGHPLDMNGKVGEMAAEVARFAARLRDSLSIEVELLDERLTTWQARQTLTELRPGSRKKGRLDDLAAAILLREYLDRRRGSANATAGEAPR